MRSGPRGASTRLPNETPWITSAVGFFRCMHAPTPSQSLWEPGCGLVMSGAQVERVEGSANVIGRRSVSVTPGERRTGAHRLRIRHSARRRTAVAGCLVILASIAIPAIEPTPADAAGPKGRFMGEQAQAPGQTPGTPPAAAPVTQSGFQDTTTFSGLT